MAQSVSVDTSSVYRLSAMVSGDFTENPLCIAYQGADGKVAFSELTPTAAADIDPHYNRYTFNIDMSALGLTSDFIYVGVKMQETGTAASHLKFGEFEFRKVSDGAVGGNLLFNGDFRMGTCGWTASTQNIFPGSSMSVASAEKADSTKFLYDRFLYVCDTSYADYQRNFINTETIHSAKTTIAINTTNNTHFAILFFISNPLSLKILNFLFVFYTCTFYFN